MNVITNKNILDFKDQLTSPKMGDKFQLDIHINNGQRLYNIVWGRKWARFREVNGHGIIRKHITEGKRILNNRYWNAARTDAFYKFCTGEKRRKSLPKNWKGEY